MGGTTLPYPPAPESVVVGEEVRVLKDMTPKYEILIRQMAITAAFQKWCSLRVTWAKRNDLDGFEVKLIEGFAAVEKSRMSPFWSET